MEKPQLTDLSLRLAIAVPAVLIACLCGFASWQLGAPAKAPAPLPLSETYYGRAIAADTPDERIAWAQKTLKVAPARAENWVLLAYAYQSKDKALSTRVLNALRQSYAVAPLSPDASEWRLDYVFSNWGLMPRDLRKLAFREAEDLVTRDGGYAYLDKLTQSIEDRQGRFSLGIIVLSRRSNQQAVWSGGRRDGE